MVGIKDIYYYLEDKWYDFLEALNKYVPVLELTDRIDKVAPSFIVFLLFLILIIAILLAAFFSMPREAEVGIIATTKTGNLIEGVQITLEQICPGAEEPVELVLITDPKGMVEFKACTETIDIKAEKKDYAVLKETLDFSEEPIKTIQLIAAKIPPKNFNAKVKDKETGQIISEATLEMLCLKGSDSNTIQIKTSLTGNKQPSAGFSFRLAENCDSIKLRATAPKYSQQTVTLTKEEENRTIELEKNVFEGTANFIADSPTGKLGGTSISVKNELDQSSYYETFSNGTITAKFEEGDYTYSASIRGFTVTGQFAILKNTTTDVNMYFDKITAPIADDADKLNKLYLKLVDGNNPVAPAEINLYFKKGNDTNYYTKMEVNTLGTIGPLIIEDYNGKTFIAVITSSGYQTKIAQLEWKKKNQEPQIIQMQQGGAKLKVKVIDDQNKTQQGVPLSLFMNDFPYPIIIGEQTDRNGEVLYKNLANATYKVTAKTTNDEGSVENIVISGQDRQVTLLLVTGRGTIKFLCIDGKNPANPMVKIYSKNSSGYAETENGKAINGAYTTKTMKAGDIVKVVINDTNYIPYESLDYTIKRGTQQKTIYLRKESGLPNENQVQMFLREIYPVNTVTSSDTAKTRKLLPGNVYYFLFELLVNVEETGTGITSIYVSPKDKNLIEPKDPLSLESAVLAANGYFVMTKNKKGFLIDSTTANQDIVDSQAKQINTINENIEGKKLLPLLVEMKIDENATGTVGVYYQAKFKEIYSIEYSKEFVIGKEFCFAETCPDFLFSNYLVWNGKENPIDSTATTKLQVGEQYKIKTIVENTSDKQIGDANLTMEIETIGRDRASFTGNNYTASQGITLAPVSSSSPKQFTLDANKAVSGSFKIYEKVERKIGAIDELSAYTGNNQYMRFEIKNKEELVIKITATKTPNQIFEKANYPIFLVETSYKSGKKAPAHWEAKINNVQVMDGNTDMNGRQLTSFDATNINAGTKIIFTAQDENNSIPALLEITVTEAYPEPEDITPKCLTVKIAGTDTKTMTYPLINLQTGKTGTITIDSNCDENRNISSKSDIYIQPKSFTIAPGETKTLTLDGTDTVKARGGMLGAYPLQIFDVGTSQYNEIAFIDVIMQDPAQPFSLTNAIFDFRVNQTQASRIVNNDLDGARKDNFYPQLSVGTNAVSIWYRQPGIPEKVTVNATIKASAIEAITYCFMWAEGLERKEDSCGGCELGGAGPVAPYEDFVFKDKAEEACTAKIEEMDSLESVPKDDPTTDETDPTKSFYSLPVAIQNKIISDSIAPTGSSSKITGTTGEMESEKKAKKLLFAESEGDPGALKTGDVFQTYPGGLSSDKTTCLKEDELGWVSAPRPPGLEEMPWQGGGETPQGWLSAVYVNDCIDPGVGAINTFEMTEGGFKVVTAAKGDNCSWHLWSGRSNDTCVINLQHEFSRAVTWEGERTATNTLHKEFTPVEGQVVSLGSYAVNIPPEWTAEECPESEETDGTKTIATLGCKGHGFIPMEAAASEEESYEMPDISSPQVTYSSNGLISYEIESVSPGGVRVFLNQETGQAYAEYLGDPTVNGKNIDFNLTNLNTKGTQYAIITVRDWANGKKTEKIFQVKLIGATNNCYSTDGVAGFTGKEFVPRLSFNWDWNGIGYDFCDAANPNYKYCDGTQFLISLFKRLYKIEEAEQKLDYKSLTALTGFYAYLIKDNYTQEFLNDFDEYYSNVPFVASSFFNTTQTSKGYDQFIAQNRIKFNIRTGNNTVPGGAIPKGGLYRIEIDLKKDNPTLGSIFSAEEPNARPEITFRLEQQAPDYNPFYETPFDGEVGKKDNLLVRQNYGASLSATGLMLNTQGIQARTYTNSLVDINYSTSTNMKNLQKGIILTYTAGKTMRFNPSQPTPVLMTIQGTGSTVTAQYKFEGMGTEDKSTQQWKMKTSTIGTGTCKDFKNSATYYFGETASNALRTIQWSNATKEGTIGLVTTFFTPKASQTQITSTRIDTTQLSSSKNLDTLTNAQKTVYLKYYDAAGAIDYDTLEGIFKRIENKQMCMSQNSEKEMTVWWNKEHLDKLINELNLDTSHNCSN